MITIGPVLGVSRSPDVDEIFAPLPPDPSTPPFTENAEPRVRAPVRHARLHPRAGDAVLESPKARSLATAELVVTVGDEKRHWFVVGSEQFWIARRKQIFNAPCQNGHADDVWMYETVAGVVWILCKTCRVAAPFMSRVATEPLEDHGRATATTTVRQPPQLPAN